MHCASNVFSEVVKPNQHNRLAYNVQSKYMHHCLREADSSRGNDCNTRVMVYIYILDNGIDISIALRFNYF